MMITKYDQWLKRPTSSSMVALRVKGRRLAGPASGWKEALSYSKCCDDNDREEDEAKYFGRLKAVRKELLETFISSGYMILQSGSISMFVKVSVLSLLPPPSSSFFFIFNIQFFIFKIQFSSFDSAAAFKVFVVVVIFVISLAYQKTALHSGKVT